MQERTETCLGPCQQPAIDHYNIMARPIPGNGAPESRWNRVVIAADQQLRQPGGRALLGVRRKINGTEPTKRRQIRKEARSARMDPIAESPRSRGNLCTPLQPAGQSSSAEPEQRRHKIPATDRPDRLGRLVLRCDCLCDPGAPSGHTLESLNMPQKVCRKLCLLQNQQVLLRRVPDRSKWNAPIECDEHSCARHGERQQVQVGQLSRSMNSR